MNSDNDFLKSDTVIFNVILDLNCDIGFVTSNTVFFFKCDIIFLECNTCFLKCETTFFLFQEKWAKLKILKTWAGSLRYVAGYRNKHEIEVPFDKKVAL